MKNKLNSLKIRISAIIFFVLLISLSAFIVIGTKYNSKMYSSEIQEKILTTINLNVEKVDRYTKSMEQKATDLALTGETLFRVLKKVPNVNIDDEIKEYLINNYESFPEAIGGGIWYDPFVFYKDKKYYGPYAYWDNDEVVFTWDLNTPEYDYLNQDWYTLALPTDWDRTQKREKNFYWTAPYYDEAGSFSLMITVDAFMYDENKKIIGISTADWAVDEMLNFLIKTKITDDSHTFLVDANSDTIMANTIDSDLVMKHTSSASWMTKLAEPKKGEIKEVNLNINNVEYVAYYTITEVGMLYGIMVPIKTINEPVNNLIRLNVTMSIILGLILLIVLYFVLSSVTSPIERLTKAGNMIADGKINTSLPEIKSKDEIKEISNTIHLLVGAIRFLKKEKKKK